MELKALLVLFLMITFVVSQTTRGSTTKTPSKASPAKKKDEKTSKTEVKTTTVTTKKQESTKKKSNSTTTKSNNVTTTPKLAATTATAEKKFASASMTTTLTAANQTTTTIPRSSRKGKKKRRTTTMSPSDKFAAWKEKYHKNYTSKMEEKTAEDNYYKADRANDEHNRKPGVTYKQGHNADSDKTYEQKKRTRMGLRVPPENQRRRRAAEGYRFKRQDDAPPDSWDFTEDMQPIKDQNDCGACWAFSTIAVLEYKVKKETGVSIQLSEQEVIDCNFDDMDCNNGGWPTYAYKYIWNYGVAASENYEYLSYMNECLRDRVNRSAYIKDLCELVMGGDEEGLKWLVYNYGPQVIVFHVTKSFTQYASGVYSEEGCPANDPNHAMVIVGYGTDENGVDYWNVKNSWGTSYGEMGYVRIARNQGNMCGICDYAIFPCDSGE